ncbi:hypothetical protein [Citrobacter arsenatis]|uniref:hypothetical protein n=1 Tax=Citrobacter arsenatis TaxID=2546350 RepID=UPI00300DEFAD
MAYRIVTINVSQTVGATPDNLQQMSAVLSFGSSTQPVGIPILITQDSDLTDALSVVIDSLSAEAQSFGSELTLTLPDDVDIGRDAGSEIDITIRDCIPDTWNGTFTATVTDSSTLTWTVPESSLDGSPTTLGTFTIGGSDDLVTAVNDFFAQGNDVATYLLELGYQDKGTVDEVAALKAYIEDPKLQFYAYLVPKSWDKNTDFISLANLYTSNESKLYFFVLTEQPSGTTDISPYKGIKSIVYLNDDAYPDTFGIANVMYEFVKASPSEINKVPPFSFRYLYGLNANQAKGSVLSLMQQQNINYVGTGAEGGISNKILVKGVAGDGNDLLYWYAVDWIQINAELTLANTVINGSNDPINPLYYDQDGIDRLQIAAQGVFNSGVKFGLVQGNPVVDAVKFSTYITDNPNDYQQGLYAGLSSTFTPKRGFTQIIFNINVTMQPAVSQ